MREIATVLGSIATILVACATLYNSCTRTASERPPETTSAVHASNPCTDLPPDQRPMSCLPEK